MKETTCKVSTVQDEKPENEKEKMDPDHWYENNLTNARDPIQ